MTKSYFKSRINALASDLDARVEIEEVADIVTAVVYVGSRLSFFVSFNSFFGKIELTADNKEKIIAEEELEKVVTQNYISALISHVENANKTLKEYV